jgi:hypothetical protein
LVKLITNEAPIAPAVNMANPTIHGEINKYPSKALFQYVLDFFAISPP